MTKTDNEGGCAEYIKENADNILRRMPELDPEYYIKSSEVMDEVADDSVDLIVTSPPYPMVELWDDFGDYEEQHRMIEHVLRESWRVLREGGIMCINIGDATRSVDGRFQCYPNHAEITVNARKFGFDTLIPIHWFKPTNRPNSFLGSGFHPPNCYVTLDTEYILIFRKGEKRSLPDDRVLWNASQFTKEERDTWFSQQWRVPGAKQEGNAQFPIEIPYRLIRMFSILGDTVLDLFAGTGTTLQIARALGRQPIGYEIDDECESTIRTKLDKVDNISHRDIVTNLIIKEQDNANPDMFIKNPSTLIDYL